MPIPKPNPKQIEIIISRLEELQELLSEHSYMQDILEEYKKYATRYGDLTEKMWDVVIRTENNQGIFN